MPHHGQGANQSIEDAVVLAEQLAKAGPGNWREAQEAYERLRRGRTRKVQYASISVADVLHLPDGPAAQARNARLAERDSVLHHLDWIHDFDALAGSRASGRAARGFESADLDQGRGGCATRAPSGVTGSPGLHAPGMTSVDGLRAADHPPA